MELVLTAEARKEASEKLQKLYHEWVQSEAEHSKRNQVELEDLELVELTTLHSGADDFAQAKARHFKARKERHEAMVAFLGPPSWVAGCTCHDCSATGTNGFQALRLTSFGEVAFSMATAEQQAVADAAAAAPVVEKELQEKPGCITRDTWEETGGATLEPLLEHTALIDIRFLIGLARRGGVLPREQEVPACARITRDTLWRLHIWRELSSLPVLVLSYPWNDPFHPDQRGELLRTLMPIFEALLKQAQAPLGAAIDDRWMEHATVGVMIDYASLPQHPRSEAEQTRFSLGLQTMHSWYVHPFTHVLLVATPPPTGVNYSNTRPYLGRGWCYFEMRMAALVKKHHLLWDFRNFHGQTGVLPPLYIGLLCAASYTYTVDCLHYGWTRASFHSCTRPTMAFHVTPAADEYDDQNDQGLRAVMTAGRAAPLSPKQAEEEMLERVALPEFESDGTTRVHHSLKFSYDADTEVVAGLYRRGFTEAFKSYLVHAPRDTLISYDQLGWGDKEANELAEAMSYMAAHDCRPPKGGALGLRLDVTLNNFSKAGLDVLRESAESSQVGVLLMKGRRKPGSGASLKQFGQ